MKLLSTACQGQTRLFSSHCTSSSFHPVKIWTASLWHHLQPHGISLKGGLDTSSLMQPNNLDNVGADAESHAALPACEVKGPERIVVMETTWNGPLASLFSVCFKLLQAGVYLSIFQHSSPERTVIIAACCFHLAIERQCLCHRKQLRIVQTPYVGHASDRDVPTRTAAWLPLNHSYNKDLCVCSISLNWIAIQEQEVYSNAWLKKGLS